MFRPTITWAAFLGATWAATGATAAAPRVIELLPYVDPQQDALAGQWTVTPEGVALAKPEEYGTGVLQLRYEPPEEYDFLLEFTPQSSGKEVVQCIYAGGCSFAWKMNVGNTNPPLYCFHVFDQKYDAKQPTRVAVQKPKTLEQGQRHTSVVEVRRGGLRALLDGEEYVKWSGDFQRFTPPWRFMLRERHLAIGANERAVVFHRLEVREISGAGKLILPGAELLTNSIGMKLVVIPAGEFLMGTKEDETAQERQKKKEYLAKLRSNGDEEKAKITERNLEDLQSELPQHRIIITKPFFLGKYEVTQAEFTKIMGFNPSTYAATSKDKWARQVVAGLDTSRFPVEHLPWESAVEFCRQLSALPEEAAAGRTYRLPTEAEWEYACRAGTTTMYYWGDQMGPKWSFYNEHVWHIGNSGKSGKNINDGSAQHPHPVGEKNANAWGLFDMIGNVGQWCADWYDPQYYAAAPLRDPAGPPSGEKRVARGHDFFMSTGQARVATRGAALPTKLWIGRGFRVACDVSAPAAQVVETTPEPTAVKDAETRLKEKGLTQRMGFFLLPEEAQFIRYCTTIERLRVACFRAQKEYQDASRQVSYAGAAQAGAVKARMLARSAIGYSDTWREQWATVRARNQASAAALLASLSKEDAQQWRKDAQDDLDSAVDLFARQIDKLQKMHQKLQADYAKLYEDETVKHAMAEMNSQGKTTYRLGPTPSALAAVKKLEHEQGLLLQFQKN